MTAGSALLFASTLVEGAALPQAALSLTLACGERPSELTLTIYNPAQTDTAVLIGIALANGRLYLPRELVVELRRRGNPRVEQLLF